MIEKKFLDIKEVIKRPEYDFLNLDDIMFLTFGGSHGYGTNRPESDIDIRGLMFNQKSDMFGFETYDKVLEHRETDTVVYGLNKAVGLFLSCNPNTIEMLGGRPDSYLITNPLAQELLDKSPMLFSQKAFYSFSGFAKDQLRRMRTILLGEEGIDIYINENILNTINHILNRHEKEDIVNFSLTNDKFFVSADHCEMSELFTILSEVMNAIKSYGKKNHRNNKKDDFHTDKHAMHLVRVYLEGIELLKTGKIVTYREKILNFY